VPNANNRPSRELLAKLGGNVRRLRQERGYTQEQLAELVDVHPRMIQTIEYGKTNILATTAMRLRAALQCRWEDLMPEVQVSRALVRAVKAGKES
jgi:transcriptional regulator with XRE-family HTH domain